MKSRKNEKKNELAPTISMVSKDEAAAALTAAGYPAENTDGVVMIDNKKQLVEKDVHAICRIFKEIGYNASWGYHGWIDDKPVKTRRRRK